jgi:hypothetical protein
LKAEIENVVRIRNQVADEIQRLDVELNSGPRVTILGDKNSPAEVPENPD